MVPPSSPTVLVVVDDDRLREALVASLQASGFATLEAATGAEALQLAARKPDAIVLDVQLPDITGFEICRCVRESPLTSSIPILMLSGLLVSEPERGQGFERGADLYLTKPVTAAELSSAVDTLLRRRRAADEAHLSLEHARLLAGQLGETLDLGEVLTRVGQVARSMLGADVVRVRLRNPTTGETALVSSVGTLHPDRETAPNASWLTVAVLESRRSVVIDDVRADPRQADPPRLAAEAVASLLGIPLLLGAEVVGVLSCWSRTPRRWSVEDVARAETIAMHAASAIHNARLFEASERRRRIAESLADVGRLISGSLDPREVGARIVESLRRLLDAGAVGLYRLDPGTGELVLGETSRPVMDWSQRLPPGEGLSALAVRERRSVTTPDVAADPRVTLSPELRGRIERSPDRAALATPLTAYDRIIGVLWATATTGRLFTDEEARVAAAFASHATIALANSELFTAHLELGMQLRARELRQAAIARLAQRAVAAEEIAPLLEAAANSVGQTLGVDHVAVFEQAPDDEIVVLRAGVGWCRGPDDDGSDLTLDAGARSHVGHVFLGHGSVIFEDLDTETRFEPSELLARHGIVSGAAIVIEGFIPPFGVLGVYSTRIRRFSDDDIAVLRATASIIGMAIVRLRAESALRRHAARLRTLRDVDQALLSSRSSQEIADVALRHLVKLIPCWRASVTLFDPEEFPAEAVFVVTGGGKDVLPAGASYGLSPSTRAEIAELRTGAVLLVEDVATIELPSAVRALQPVGLRGYFRVPLAARGELIGLLDVGFDRPRAFSGEDVEIAREVAEPLAVALEQARLHERVVASRSLLQAMSRRMVEVQETERAHLARELHDEIGQLLTGLKLSLEALERSSREITGAVLASAKSQVADLMGRVRALSLDLRPAGLDDLGLADALVGFFGRYTAQTHVDVRFEQRDVEGRRFRREVETAAYRIVQEALTNVARHAGVRAVTVRAWADEHHLGVQVEDAGAGFRPHDAFDPGRAGLAGMRERTALLGGRCEIESAPGAGTRVTVELPLET